MPELQWDPFDFFYCLEVEPHIEDEYETHYIYEVRRDDLILQLTVRPMESIITLSLKSAQTKTCPIEFTLFVHGKVAYINDKRGEYLEFGNCILAPRRFSYLEAEKVWATTKPQWTVELSIKPHIQIRYLD